MGVVFRMGANRGGGGAHSGFRKLRRSAASSGSGVWHLIKTVACPAGSSRKRATEHVNPFLRTTYMSISMSASVRGSGLKGEYTQCTHGGEHERSVHVHLDKLFIIRTTSTIGMPSQPGFLWRHSQDTFSRTGKKTCQTPDPRPADSPCSLASISAEKTVSRTQSQTSTSASAQCSPISCFRCAVTFGPAS